MKIKVKEHVGFKVQSYRPTPKPRNKILSKSGTEPFSIDHGTGGYTGYIVPSRKTTGGYKYCICTPQKFSLPSVFSVF